MFICLRIMDCSSVISWMDRITVLHVKRPLMTHSYSLLISTPLELSNRYVKLISASIADIDVKCRFTYLVLGLNTNFFCRRYLTYMMKMIINFRSMVLPSMLLLALFG